MSLGDAYGYVMANADKCKKCRCVADIEKRPDGSYIIKCNTYSVLSEDDNCNNYTIPSNNLMKAVVEWNKIQRGVYE